MDHLIYYFFLAFLIPDATALLRRRVFANLSCTLCWILFYYSCQHTYRGMSVQFNSHPLVIIASSSIRLYVLSKQRAHTFCVWIRPHRSSPSLGIYYVDSTLSLHHRLVFIRKSLVITLYPTTYYQHITNTQCYSVYFVVSGISAEMAH